MIMVNDRCKTAGLWYSRGWLFGNLFLAGWRGKARRKRTTTTMSKGQPWGENQAPHLIHLARREMPRTQIGTVGHTGTSLARGERTGRRCKTSDGGTCRGTVESPGFSHGECQIARFLRIAGPGEDVPPGELGSVLGISNQQRISGFDLQAFAEHVWINRIAGQDEEHEEKLMAHIAQLQG